MPIPCLLALHNVPLLSLTITNLIGNSDNELVAIHSEAENLEELNREINQYKAKVVLLENSNPLALWNVKTWHAFSSIVSSACDGSSPASIKSSSLRGVAIYYQGRIATPKTNGPSGRFPL